MITTFHADDSSKAKGSQIASQGGGALDEFEEAMSAKTGQAVTEGKHDVDEAKTSGAVYIQQAKQTAADVANAAQVCMAPSVAIRQQKDKDI